MINQCFFVHDSPWPNHDDKSCSYSTILRVWICIDFDKRAIAPLKLHVKPPFGWCKSRIFQKMVVKHAATVRFWEGNILSFSITCLLCSFNTHFDAFSTNIKMGIDLSAACIAALDLKPLSSKLYPVSHLQKPMKFYQFAMLRESTIAYHFAMLRESTIAAPVLLSSFFWCEPKHHPF